MRTFDAQAAMGFVISQTSHIESAVYNMRYADIQYPQLIPVDTSAHPFAKTITFFSQDKAGAAEWLNGNADDVPMADTERSQFESAIYTAGIGYGYGWEEINQAQMLGMNLAADKAAAARRAYEEFVDRVALEGDTSKGFEGLFDHSSVTAAAAPTGDWGTATGDQILADINAALTGITAATNYVAMGDTLILPYAKMELIASTRLGDTTMTILEFIRMNNVYTAMTGSPLMIRAARKLDDAGVSATARLVAYRRSPEVMKLHIPMPHRFLPVFQSGPMRWDVPGVFRLGGLDIRLPSEVRYLDGI